MQASLDTQTSHICILFQGVPQFCSQFLEEPSLFVLSWSPMRATQLEGMINNLYPSTVLIPLLTSRLCLRNCVFSRVEKSKLLSHSSCRCCEINHPCCLFWNSSSSVMPLLIQRKRNVLVTQKCGWTTHLHVGTVMSSILVNKKWKEKQRLEELKEHMKQDRGRNRATDPSLQAGTISTTVNWASPPWFLVFS